MYIQGGPKKMAHFLYTLTSSNIYTKFQTRLLSESGEHL